MRKIFMIVALATFLFGGHGVVSAASVYTAVNDTVPENNQARKGLGGLGGLLGGFLGGGSKDKGNSNNNNNSNGGNANASQQNQSSDSNSAKDALGGILGGILGGGKGQNGDGGKVGDVVGSIFNGIAGNKLSAEMLVGTWNYSGSKLVLKSDDIVKKMGSEAMVTPIEKKLNGYLAKVGFKEGGFSYTFNADGTFTADFNGRPMKGKYTLDLENKTINMNFFSVVKTNLTLTVVNQQLGMLHDADKLLDLIRGIASKSSSASVKSINTLLGSYNGLQVGMEFKKAQ